MESSVGSPRPWSRTGYASLPIRCIWHRPAAGTIQIRASDRPLDAQADRIELLLALTPEAVAQHWPELGPGGIIYDKGLKLPCTEGELKERGIQVL